jgi:hypothetical protein
VLVREITPYLWILSQVQGVRKFLIRIRGGWDHPSCKHSYKEGFYKEDEWFKWDVATNGERLIEHIDEEIEILPSGQIIYRIHSYVKENSGSGMVVTEKIVKEADGVQNSLGG